LEELEELRNGTQTGKFLLEHAFNKAKNKSKKQRSTLSFKSLRGAVKSCEQATFSIHKNTGTFKNANLSV
jgi:hypothetical protein